MWSYPLVATAPRSTQTQSGSTWLGFLLLCRVCLYRQRLGLPTTPVVWCKQEHAANKTHTNSRTMTVLYEKAPSPQQPLSGQEVLVITGFRKQNLIEGRDLRLSMVNGRMVGRSREVMGMLARKKVDIC